MKDATPPTRALGDLLQDFVGKVAHRSGRTLATMNEASVTLHQVILLNRLVEAHQSTVSDLAASLRMSMPSVSQMVDRLHRLELVTRAEMSDDRRKKLIELTHKGRALLARLADARSAEFELGTSSLSAPVQSRLVEALSQALHELNRRHQVVSV